MDQVQEETMFAKVAIFDDPRNIQVGSARIIWAPELPGIPEGWALPGGSRTQSKYVATGVAMNIDDIHRRSAAA